MPFICRKIESLPKLAWLAVLQPGLADVTVFHGPWVETDSAEFFEGAWNGAYDQRRFDSATKNAPLPETTLRAPVHPVVGAYAIARPPVVFGRVQSFNADQAKAVPGVLQIIEMPALEPPALFKAAGGIAVIAENSWAALKARDLLEITWDDGANADYDSAA